jgi:hypothetical protein
MSELYRTVNEGHTQVITFTDGLELFYKRVGQELIVSVAYFGDVYNARSFSLRHRNISPKSDKRVFEEAKVWAHDTAHDLEREIKKNAGRMPACLPEMNCHGKNRVKDLL